MFSVKQWFSSVSLRTRTNVFLGQDGSARRSRRRQRGLSLERLEGRILLAGDVIPKGDLVVELETVATGLVAPLGVTHAGDDSDRLGASKRSLRQKCGQPPSRRRGKKAAAKPEKIVLRLHGSPSHFRDVRDVVRK